MIEEKESIVVTIPKTTPIETIRSEMIDINTEGKCGNHKVGRVPKKLCKHIYFVYDGAIRFKANVLSHTYKMFKCETTGRMWPNSIYIEFNEVEELEKPIAMKGFQGFRYLEIES